MGHCRECKHWEEGRGDSPPGWGGCALTEADWGGERHPESLAQAKAFSSYPAVLATSAAFGCVQFKRKEVQRG